MDGNNFLDGNPNNKIKKRADDEREISWISPQSDSNAADNVPENLSADKPFFPDQKKSGFFDFFAKSDEATGQKNSDFADNKKILGEYRDSLNNSGKKSAARKNISGQSSPLISPSQSGALKTNLVKEDVTTFVDWRKNIILLLIGIIFSLALVGGLYGRLILSERQAYKTSGDLDQEIAELKSRINTAVENNREAEKFQQKLKLANGLLKNHVYWTNYFKFLEDNILSDTYIISGISASHGSNFSFDISAKSYANIDEQLMILRENNLVKKAEIKSGQLEFNAEKGGSRVKYSLDIEILPEVFLKK